MTEIVPNININNDEKVKVEDFIGMLMQNDSIEGVVSSEFSDYQNILARWRKKEISDEEATVEALAVSAARQQNYH